MSQPQVIPHVFLTRFNLPANRVEQSIFSDEWLTDRMRLFEKYTVPSVRQQTNVRWIIYLDQSTPPWLRDRMSELEAELPLWPFYLDRALTPQAIRSHLKEVVPEGGPVMTSNLDNDDGLASDYVDRLRALVPDIRPVALYLTAGLIRADGEVYRRHDRSNAFSAVVDDLSSATFETCWSRFHNQLEEVMPAVRGDGAPAWLQVVHGRNVSNRVGGRLADPRQFARLFPGLLDDAAAPTVRTRTKDLLARPTRTVRDRVLRPGAAVVRRVIGQDRYETLRLRLQRR